MPVASAYVETSVLGAYYCPEPLSMAAETALRAVDVPVISTLTEVEFTSLVARKQRLRELKARQANEVLQLFERHVQEGFFRRVPLGTELLLHAARLIRLMSSSLRTLDALHLATAMSENLPLLTSDRALAQAAKRHQADAILLR